MLALDPTEGAGGLRRLGRALYEGACAFYLDDARRRLALHSERRTPAPAVSARVAFKARLPAHTALMLHKTEPARHTSWWRRKSWPQPKALCGVICA